MLIFRSTVYVYIYMYNNNNNSNNNNIYIYYEIITVYIYIYVYIYTYNHVYINVTFWRSWPLFNHQFKWWFTQKAREKHLGTRHRKGTENFRELLKPLHLMSLVPESAPTLVSQHVAARSSVPILGGLSDSTNIWCHSSLLCCFAASDGLQF